MLSSDSFNGTNHSTMNQRFTFNQDWRLCINTYSKPIKARGNKQELATSLLMLIWASSKWHRVNRHLRQPILTETQQDMRKLLDFMEVMLMSTRLMEKFSFKVTNWPDNFNSAQNSTPKIHS